MRYGYLFKKNVLRIALFLFLLFSSALSAQDSKLYKEIDGHRLYYLTAGKEGNDTIVLIHGLFAQKEQWLGLMKILSENGYYVIDPDMPGYGESNSFPLPDYTISKQIKLLNKFLSSLNITQFNIAGNSLGGAIAIGYSQKYPKEIKSIALIGGSVCLGRWDKAIVDEFLKGFNPFIPLDAQAVQAEMKLLFYTPPVIDDKLVNTLIKNYKDNYSRYNQIFNIFCTSSYNCLLDMKKNNIKNVLVLWGKEDKILEPPSEKKIKKIFPYSKYIILDKSGHLPMIENTNEVGKLYLNFLAKVNK